MRIDVARPEEYAEIGALNVAAYEEYRAVVGDETWVGMRAALEAVDELAAGAELLVAKEAGRLQGAVIYAGPGCTRPPLPAEWASIRALAVPPWARGCGAGRALVEACIARARLNEAETIGLYTTEMMATARGLYARLGFVDDGPLPPRHGQPCRRYRIDLTSSSTCHIL